MVANKVDNVRAEPVPLKNGDVLIAAITSCTNTSNPGVLLAAGLLAKKAVKAGLAVKPHVKTSLAPGSQVVTDYLNKAGPAGPNSQPWTVETFKAEMARLGA
mgnify:CR=1 FL=1